MKTRMGFVSNSSTSGFIICGFKLADSEDYKALEVYMMITKKTVEDITEEIQKENIRYNNPDKKITDYDIADYCDEAIYSNSLFEGVDIECGEGVPGVIVGKSVCDVGGCGDIDEDEIDILEMIKKVERIRDSVEGCTAEVKIYTGTKSC